MRCTDLVIIVIANVVLHLIVQWSNMLLVDKNTNIHCNGKLSDNENLNVLFINDIYPLQDNIPI